MTNLELLKKQIEQLPHFSPSAILYAAGEGLAMAVDQKGEQVAFVWRASEQGQTAGWKILDFSDIVGAEVIRDGKTITHTTRQGVLGRTVGGALLGLPFGVFGMGVGAIIRGTTAPESGTSHNVTTYEALRVSVADTSFPAFVLPTYYETQSLLGSNEHYSEQWSTATAYDNGLGAADHWMELIRAIVQLSETISPETRASTLLQLHPMRGNPTRSVLANSELRRAIEGGDIAYVKRLLRKIPRDAIKTCSETLLWTSFYKSKPQLEVAELLRELGVDLEVQTVLFGEDNAQESKQETGTFLEWACLLGKTDVALFLLSHGARFPKERDRFADLVFFAAAGESSLVTALRSACVDVDYPDSDGVTLLMEAIRSGHAQQARGLVGARANVNASDSSGYTPLSYARARAMHGIERLLLERGADPACKSIQPPLHDLPDTYCNWLDKKSREASKAVIAGDLALVKSLLQGQHPDDLLPVEGQPLLALAVLNQHASVARFLIEAGADVNWANPEDGATALHLAAALGEADIICSLVSAGARTEAATRDGETPIRLAAKLGHERAAEVLRNVKS